MDFEATEEQESFRRLVIDFARRELAGPPRADGRLDRARWRSCARVGIQGLPIAAEYGGSGADAMTTVIALEALGYACADSGLVFSLNAHMWACAYPLQRVGTEEQKRRYLPGLCDGSLVAAHAMTEPGSGSDAFALGTTATPDGDHYVLRGSKTFVTNAPDADLMLVFATTDPSRPLAGICAFLVEPDAPGVAVGRPLRKMGLETSPMAEVFLDGCRVPASAMLGVPGSGVAVFTAAMERERGFILASAVGTMERDLERCLRHARERRQFGRPIGGFQAVSHRIVDMRLRLETARLLLRQLAWRVDRGQPAALESALVKLHLSESFLQSSLDAVQVHGGYGYMAEYEVEQHVRDAVASRLYSGTSEVQRNLAARLLGLDG